MNQIRLGVEPPRQIRISVNGVLQFTIKANQNEPLSGVADRARETMRLGDTLEAHISPGQINFGLR